MSTQVKLRRGSRGELATFTPAFAEMVIDTDNYSAHVGDGSTVGGLPLAGRFEHVADMKTRALPLGFRVSCDRYFDAGEELTGLVYVMTNEVADGYINHTMANGLTATLIIDKAVSIKHAGVIGTKGAVQPNIDESVRFKAALDSGYPVYVPTGNYLINCNIEQKVIIFGDGALNSRLKPTASNTAALTYAYAAMTSRGNTAVSFWDYTSEVRDIGFYGDNQEGVGFTFAKVNPALFVDNDQFAGNVKFYGCHFYNLFQGVQFPFGNIGTEFYSCGFRFNKYGIYTLNSKYGPLMHAGNKHFYGGEFSSNSVAMYCHNGDGIGLADISFKDTIIENNLIALYLYNDTIVTAGPAIKCDGVWFEKNGFQAGVNDGSTTVDIDAWTGTTKSVQTVDITSQIYDGSGYMVVITKSGIVNGIQLRGSEITIKVDGSFVAQDEGNISQPNIVTDPFTSVIRQIDCFGSINSQPPSSVGNEIEGRYAKRLFDVASGANSNSSWWRAPLIRKSSIETPDSLLLSMKGDSLPVWEIGGGTFSIDAIVVADDGVAHTSCMEFTRTDFLVGELAFLFAPVNTDVLLLAGYHVLTFSVKCTSGSIGFSWWDRNTRQAAVGMECSAGEGWTTFVSVVKVETPAQIYLECNGRDTSSTGLETTWRMADVQIHSFNKYTEAQAFAAEGVFYASGDEGASQILKIGDFGLAAEASVLTLDPRTITKQGSYYWTNSTTNLPDGANAFGGTITHVPRDESFGSLRATQTAVDATGRIWTTFNTNGAWNTWQETFTSLNTNFNVVGGVGIGIDAYLADGHAFSTTGALFTVPINEIGVPAAMSILNIAGGNPVDSEFNVTDALEANKNAAGITVLTYDSGDSSNRQLVFTVAGLTGLTVGEPLKLRSRIASAGFTYG